MNRSMITILATTIALVALAPASAGVVHKWVDEDGITHYSDEIPLSIRTPVTSIEIPEVTAAAGDAISDEYSIANQWRRMHQERIERDKLALEKTRLKAAQQQTTEVVYVEQPQESRYVLSYPGFRYRKHGHNRSHYKYGRRIKHVNREPIHEYHRTDGQSYKSNIGYSLQIQ